MDAIGNKKKDTRPPRPTIHLEVRLPNIGTITDSQQENDPVTIDFLKLSEQKYGPTSNSIFPLNGQQLNDLDDDDDDPAVDADGDVDLEHKEAPPSKGPAKKPKNRGRVEGKYDLEDPFIDDSEMAWEEQAASTQDGFFVYQGPLQAEEPEKPASNLKVNGEERKKPGPPKGSVPRKKQQQQQNDKKKETSAAGSGNAKPESLVNIAPKP